mmetsp:Transcript_34957/g.110426  ORF Transcript_34957/g.110426 Transcript_34957/m.110426 type:complete len:191 (-) Transcript_34957:78-650(-)
MHVGYGGSQMDEVLQKREEEISTLREELEHLHMRMAGSMKENSRYQAMYGDLPEETAVQEGTEEEEPAPAVNMHELLDVEKARAARLDEELASIRREALLSRGAVEQLHTHLKDEKSLFSQLRSEVAGLARKGGEATAADGKRVDQMVKMGQWKVDECLKKMDSAAAASKQVEAAAVAVRDAMKNAEGGP